MGAEDAGEVVSAVHSGLPAGEEDHLEVIGRRAEDEFRRFSCSYSSLQVLVDSLRITIKEVI